MDYLAKIAVPVLVLGGANSPDWFHRTVEATTDAIPGARLVMLDGQDHGAPPEVLAPVLTGFFLGCSLGRLRLLGSLRFLGAAGHQLGCGGEAWRRPLRLPGAGWCRSRATRWTAEPSCCGTGR